MRPEHWLPVPMIILSSRWSPAGLWLASRLFYPAPREGNSRARNENNMTRLVVDRKALLESMENDAEFLKTIIGIFLADCPGKLAATRAGVVAHNLREVMQASHSLKG